MVLEFFVPHYNGGGEHRYHEIAKRLVSLGHQVDLLTMRVKDVPEYEDIDGINVYHIGPIINNPPQRSFGAFLRYLFSVSSWLLHHDYDVVDAQAYSPLLSSSIVSRITKTPLIGTIHDTSSSSNDQWIQSSRTANFMEKFLVNLKFNKIITVSHATKNSLVNDFGVDASKIEILYNGVDIKKYDSVTVDGTVENQIIFIGRFAPHKHVDHLIRSVHEIKKVIPSIQLLIIGKGEEKDALIDLTNQLNLEDNVTFKQNLSDEELIQSIKESEILVLPSTREGFGMVLAEANACYKPVITYASGGTVEVVQDGYNGFLIQSEDTQCLTNKIRELLENKDLQENYGLNGRRKVEQDFDWDKIVNQYIIILKKLIYEIIG
jgi:glycosyltransferase involved in cell wall biosynthesis